MSQKKVPNLYASNSNKIQLGAFTNEVMWNLMLHDQLEKEKYQTVPRKQKKSRYS